MKYENNMIKKAAVLVFFVSLILGCTEQQSPLSEESVPEQRTVRGVLSHFPSDVRSAQAWHGHNFIVGDTPVIATETVSEERLKTFIGLTVIVTGVWHPGEKWNPTE